MRGRGVLIIAVVVMKVRKDSGCGGGCHKIETTGGGGCHESEDSSRGKLQGMCRTE